MKYKRFKLILKGPPGSGKTTFLEELLHMYKVHSSWQERYNFKPNPESHELLIERVIPLGER